MGRFYRTANPQMLDYMYQLPEAQMLQVIQNKDRQIAANEAATLELYDKLQANALTKDEVRRDEIISGYENRVDDLVNQLQEDPLAYAKKDSEIRGLARDIHQDWTRGEISAIEGNYAARQAYVQKYADLVNKGEANAIDFQIALDHFDNTFQGTQYDMGTGVYNPYSTEELAKYANIEDIAETRGNGYLADVVERLGAYSDGKYLYTSEDKQEFVKYEDILQGVTSALMNDKELRDYYGQRIKFGQYSADEVNDIYRTAAERVAEKYSYLKDKKGKTSVKADPFALQKDKYDREKDLYGYKKNLDMVQNVATDRNNEQVKYNTMLGKTVEEREANLTALNDAAVTPIMNVYQHIQSQFNAKLKDGNLTPEQIQAENMRIQQTYQQAMEGDFSGLRTLAEDYNLGIDGYGSGVDDLENNYNNIQTRIENETRVYDNIRNSLEKALEEELANDPNSTLVPGTNDFENELDNRMNQVLASESFNTTTLSVYSTQGDYFDNQDIPIAQRSAFKAHLDAVAQFMPDFLGEDLYITDESGNLVSGTINNLIQDGILKYGSEENIDANGNITITENGKPVTFSRGQTRLVPQELPEGVGQDAYQQTYILNDPETGKPRKYTVYVPYQSFPMDAEQEQIIDSKRNDIVADEVERKAKVQYTNPVNLGLIDEEDAWYKTDDSGIEYNPNLGWKFVQDDGQEVILAGEEGKNAYRAYLNAKNGSGYNDQYDFTFKKEEEVFKGQTPPKVKYYD
jgi:hypothetical protein